MLWVLAEKKHFWKLQSSVFVVHTVGNKSICIVNSSSWPSTIYCLEFFLPHRTQKRASSRTWYRSKNVVLLLNVSEISCCFIPISKSLVCTIVCICMFLSHVPCVIMQNRSYLIYYFLLENFLPYQKSLISKK